MTKHHFKILPEHQLQNLDQTLKLCAPSLNKNLALRPNFTFLICTELLSTHFSSSTWATVTTSTSFELSSSHARVTSIKFIKRHGVSQWVSDKHSQWSDSGPIKKYSTPCLPLLRESTYVLWNLIVFLPPIVHLRSIRSGKPEHQNITLAFNMEIEHRIVSSSFESINIHKMFPSSPGSQTLRSSPSSSLRSSTTSTTRAPPTTSTCSPAPP